MPYREEKPLADLIAPDRRREKTIALVVIGMLMGAGALYALQQVTKESPTVVSTASPPTVTPFSATLSGPDGTFTIPTRGKRTVVNVWLQGCADCMPAFEAMKKVESSELGPNVVNVAYGNADPSWAAQYGVRQNLVFDPGGSQVVHPLGISSFTTLVFDEDGKILARDRPDRPGYVERIHALVDSSPLGAKDIEAVVATKHAAIRAACWNGRDLKQADVTVSAVIAPNGSVVSTGSHGSDKELGRCLEAEVKRWRFRETRGTSVTVDIPFKLRRDE